MAIALYLNILNIIYSVKQKFVKQDTYLTVLPLILKNSSINLGTTINY